MVQASACATFSLSGTYIDSKAAFTRKLEQIRDGLCAGGIACLIETTSVQKRDKATGKKLAMITLHQMFCCVNFSLRLRKNGQ